MPRKPNMLSLYVTGAALAMLCLSAQASGIQKCIVNGKTVYTDEGCKGGFISKNVEIQHAAGVVSPDRATIDDTLERARLKRWVEEQPGRSATRTTTRNGHTQSHSYDNPLPIRTSAPARDKKAVCDSHAKHIEYLDAMARQPQNASTLDWIKGERAKTVSAMYDAKC